MARSYGMPGPGGSLGKCCWCGNTFMLEILQGDTVQEVSIGGTDMFVHKKRCLDALVEFAGDGQFSAKRWPELPGESPLRDALKRLCEEADAKGVST